MAQLRVVVPTPLPEPLCEFIERAESRLELVRDQSLLPPHQHPADHSGDPSFRRSPKQLRPTGPANPRLRWVHTTPAGGGGQVKAAGLDAADLARIVFTTSAGGRAEPLAEFALLGVLAGARDLPRLLADQRSNTWGDRRSVPLVGGRRVLVVGLGGIGRSVTGKLAALGAHVV